jgi:hypothetical protein
MSITSPLHETATPERASLTIRWATADDAAALSRLAALDSSEVPIGRLLVAEVDGELRAAVPATAGPGIADPFRPTADLVALLEMRVRHLRRDGNGLRRAASSPRPRLLLRTLRA